jgi:hypothetical protein
MNGVVIKGSLIGVLAFKILDEIIGKSLQKEFL